MQRLELLILISVSIPCYAQESGFWTKENKSLLVLSSAARAGDIITTKNLIGRGGHEVLLPQFVVKNRGIFIAESVGEQAAVFGLAYVFHRKRWHRAEKAILWVNFSSTAACIVNNSLRKGRPDTPIQTPKSFPSPKAM